MGMVDLRSEKEERKGVGHTHTQTHMTEKDRQRGHAEAWTKRGGFFHDQVVTLLIIGGSKGSASLKFILCDQRRCFYVYPDLKKMTLFSEQVGTF